MLDTARSENKELLWKQYQLNVDLYKHYLDLVVKFNLFYYAVTGAILSFYFSKPEIPMLKYSLLFPILLSVGFGGFFFYGARLVGVVRRELFQIRDILGFYAAPEFKVLSVLLQLSACLFFFVAICLLYLFFSGGIYLPNAG